MPVDVAGAAVGAALGGLLSLAQVGAVHVAATRHQRKKMESFLKLIYPIIQENSDLYDQLGPQQEMDLMKILDEGKELVKRKRIPWYKPLKKCKHSNKLTKYSATLHDRLLILILLLELRKMKEIREELRLIRSGQANGGALQSRLGDLGNLAVPAAPPLMVESEIEAFRENIPLLEEKVPAIVKYAPGGRGETTQLKPAQALSSPSCHPQDAETGTIDTHREETQHLQNMQDHVVEIKGDDDQWLQKLQQGWPDLAIIFHVVFGLLKLLMITYFHSLYPFCEVIYLISLVEVTRPGSSTKVYWYLYLIFGTLGFELLLWTNLSLVMWLVINLSSLVVFAAASSHLLMRGFEKSQPFALLFDDMRVSEKFKIFMPLLAVKTLTNREEIMAKLRWICSGQANGVALQRVPEIIVDASGGCGETLSPDGEIRAQALSSSSCHSPHMAINMPHLLMSDSSTTENPRNMVDLHQAVTTQGKNGRDDDQWPQNQQQQQQQQQLQQGWSDSP